MAQRLHAPINHQLHHHIQQQQQQQDHRDNIDDNLDNNDEYDLINGRVDDDETDQLYENNYNDRSTNEDNNPSSSRAKQHLYLTDCKSFYSCIHCHSHLANHDHLVSRAFTGSHGRAHLFDKVVNINYDEPVLRNLITGQHLVSDIFCARCETRIGWRYEKAYVESQKYKEGKFVIELYHVVRENRHLEMDESERFFGKRLNDYYFDLSGDYDLCSQTNNNSENLRLDSAPGQTTATETAGAASSTLLADEDKSSSINPTITPRKSLEILARSDTSKTRSLHASNQERNMARKPNLSFGEDLLFTFYDDWCSVKSSYPSNLSKQHFDRKRKSLYLESKPFDWKQPSEIYDEGQHFNPLKRDDSINSNSRDTHILPSTSAASSSGVSSGISIASPSSSCCDTSTAIQQRFGETKPPLTPRRHKLRTESLCHDLGSNDDDSSIDGDETQFELETDQDDWQDNDNISSQDKDSKLNKGMVRVDDEEYYDCCEP